MWYNLQQKGGRGSLRRNLRAKREIYVRAVLATSVYTGIKKDAPALATVRTNVLATWYRQLRRVTGEGVRAMCDVRRDQLSLFDAVTLEGSH